MGAIDDNAPVHPCKPAADDRERLRRDPLGLLARRVAEAAPRLPRVRLGARTVVLVARPEQVRVVLAERLEQLRKPAFLRESNRGRGGDGLTTLEGQAWRERRACLRGAFAPARVRAHRAVVRAHAQQLAARWHTGDVVELRHELRQLTAASAVRFVLGADVEGWSGSSGLPPARRTVEVPLEEAHGEDFTAVAEGDVPLALTRPRAPASMPVTVAIIDAAIRARALPEPHPRDALSWSVAAGLDRGAIVDELQQMLFAGHHTVPTTLLAVLRVLARDPTLARRVRAEAVAAGSSDLPPASLTERVVQETMRVLPAAPILYREVAEPLALAGERLEPGTGVWVCTQVLHHDPHVFPRPERFEPERFAPSARARIPAYAYLPFGAGPRVCAASRLAMVQLVETCAVLVRTHALRPCSGDRFVVERVG